MGAYLRNGGRRILGRICKGACMRCTVTKVGLVLSLYVASCAVAVSACSNRAGPSTPATPGFACWAENNLEVTTILSLRLASGWPTLPCFSARAETKRAPVFLCVLGF